MIDSEAIEIELTESEVNKAKTFSEQVVHTDVYAFRNGQFDSNRRREQHLSSKLAELAVYQFISNRGINITEPDFSIKQCGNKSWAPDLELSCEYNEVVDFNTLYPEWRTVRKVLPLHVKSQDMKSMQKYGLSWIGEKSDKEMYIGCTGYTALCLVDSDLKKVAIYGLLETITIKQLNLFAETKLQKHREKKFAIYYKDIEKQPSFIKWKLLSDAQLL